MIRHRHALVPLALLLAVGCAPAQTGTVPSGSTSAAPTTPTPSTSAGSSGQVSPTPAASTAASGYALSGQVLDDARLAVSGATISAVAGSQPAITVQTGSDGNYTMQVPPGTYTVTATKSGWTTRTQNVTVSGNTTLSFGTDVTGGTDPHFLSNTPEIESASAKEDAPGGPLTLTLNLSEPITAESQQNFKFLLSVDSGTSTQFLRASGVTEDYLQNDASFDATGKVFTMKYAKNYLASGPIGNTTYTVHFRQSQLDTKDPVTREQQWEDMHMVDLEGNPMGKNRADYLFYNPDVSVLQPVLLTDFTYGYTTDARRWNLTHKGLFTWTAAADTTQPQLLRVDATVNQAIGNFNEDLINLHFNKPMHAVKDAQHLEFTQLSTDKSKQLLVMNVSKNANGSSPTSLDIGNPSKIEFSKADPDLVILHYPANVLKDQEWIEITLLDDFRDPVNNPVDPAHSRVSGPVVGGT